VIGRPILYKTSKEFLLRFGLKDVHERLPSMEEFEKLLAESFQERPAAERGTPVEEAPSLPRNRRVFRRRKLPPKLPNRPEFEFARRN